MRKKDMIKEIKSITANEHDWTYIISYADNTSQVYNLATIPAEIVNKCNTFRRVNTTDHKVYILIP